jgi:hypothetical protein
VASLPQGTWEFTDLAVMERSARSTKSTGGATDPYSA